MDPFIQFCFFLWISTGFLSKAERSEPYTDNDGEPSLQCELSGSHCKHIFKNVCYEFAEEPKSWFHARRTCQKRGGELLKLINWPVKGFLHKFATERNTTNLTWWLGQGVPGEYQGPPMVLKSITENSHASEENSPSLCTYLRFNPLQLITTSDCSKKRGHLCTQDLQFLPEAEDENVSSAATESRLAGGPGHMMSLHVADIERLLQVADEELMRMEMSVSEPTNENRSLFEQIFEIQQAISSLLGRATSQPLIYRHSTGVIYQNRMTPAELGGVVLGSEKDGLFVKFPPYSALKSHLGSYTNVNTQLSSLRVNPHPSEENITGSVCKLFLSDGTEDIHLSNLTEMMEIFLPHPKPSTVSNNTIVMENNGPVLTTFNITDPNVTVLFSAEPNPSMSLLLRLSPRSPPNSTYESSKTVLNQSGSYRWLVTPDLLQRITGVWYIETTIINSTWVPGTTLCITTFIAKCMYWDVEMEMWRTDGCVVGEESTANCTQCRCNHLTLFGSSFFVMPNYVDLSSTAELFATASQNYVVLALVCTVFGLYLVTLLCACYADRRSLSRRKMTLLEDSHPCAQYNYQLSVQTSHRKNAGTSANVTVTLIGSNGESETQTLTDPDKPVLERKAVDMFLLTVPFPLGELRTIRLQHDNSGGHPSWYVNKVTVQDLQTRQVWHFLCDCWLSADHGDGFEKMFNAAKKNEIASFRNIFQSRTSTGFRDEHIWVSIVDPPWRSPFTRAQRVSCCMSLLLCTMAINIAFWNIPKDEDSPVLFSFGSVNITWQEIMVGVQSGLLMFPINILIITIFRSIKPRLASKAQKRPVQISSPQTATIQTILKETEAFIGMLSSSPRNKVLELNGRLETTSDLCPALDRVHELIQFMQGQSESDPHWVYCSRFVMTCLAHLLLCLEKVDVRSFQSSEEHQQALGFSSLLLRKARMVFTSHISCCPPPVSRKEKKKPKGCWLPWWCVFLGWFLLLSISGVSTFFTLLYGFQYGKQKSTQWVISLGLSLFQSIFILQPLKVIGVAIFFALLLKPVAVEEDEELEQVLFEQQDKCRQYCGEDRQ